MENKRLTKKIIEKNVDGYVLNHREDFTENTYEVIQKLGKLEDLEEQLGCPLEILFRALSDGIYRYNYERKLTFEKVLYIGKDDNNVYYINWLGSWNERLKNYKKTWWLREDKSE